MVIVLIVTLITLSAVAAYLKTPVGKGVLGELRVRWMVGKTRPGTRYVLNNYIFMCDGRSVQIDHIVINKNGVFIIETKNYSGRIYGSDDQKRWTQVLAHGKVKNKIYSPVKQNASHIYKLGRVLGIDAYLTSVVVFVQNNTRFLRSDIAIPISTLKKKLKLPSKLKPYSKDEMELIYSAFESQRNTDITLKEHVQGIHKARELAEHDICPFCKLPLVTRKGKHGDFLGCSGYPRCTYTKKG